MGISTLQENKYLMLQKPEMEIKFKHAMGKINP